MSLSTSTLFVRDRFTWLAYVMLAVYAYLQASLGPLMPFLRAELRLDYTVAGLHFSAFAVGMILTGLTGDHVAQRLGRHATFWMGAAGMAAATAILAFGRQPTVTIGAILVMGFFGSLLLVMVQATLSDRHGAQRAIALTEANVVAIAGAGLAPLLVGGFQALGGGWRSALFFALAFFVLLAVRFIQQPVPESSPVTGANVSDRSPLPLAFWAYWTVLVLSVSVEWCMVFWGADFLENVAGLTRSSAATSMTFLFLAMLIGRMAGSRLTRRLPSARLLLGALAVTALGFPLFWLSPQSYLSVTGLFVTGLGLANLFPLTLAAATGVAAGRADAASARISLGIGLAILTAPLVLGWLADQITIQNAFGIVVILLLLAAAVTVVTNRLAQ